MVEDTMSKRLHELENIKHSDISLKMTLEEADSIVHIYGDYATITGFLPIVFPRGIPESFLPFPKPILIGALQKMIWYCERKGNEEKYLSSLQSTLSLLLLYDSDAEALSNAASNFENSDWLNIFVGAVQEGQNREMERGFFFNGKFWGMTQERKTELLNELDNHSDNN